MTDTPYSISLNTPYRSVECQYAVLNSQNTPYCLEKQIRRLDNRIQYAVLGRRFDTSYPTGGYGVSASEDWAAGGLCIASLGPDVIFNMPEIFLVISQKINVLTRADREGRSSVSVLGLWLLQDRAPDQADYAFMLNLTAVCVNAIPVGRLLYLREYSMGRSRLLAGS
ncbi:hypothetical protein Tco_0403983 [Tanacetum coccineum]